jgi:hypothetical protein
VLLSTLESLTAMVTTSGRSDDRTVREGDLSR